MFDWIHGNLVTTCVIGSAISVVVAHKLYWKYKYSLKQFDRSHANLNNVAILITCVTSGIGYNTAIKLVYHKIIFILYTTVQQLTSKDGKVGDHRTPEMKQFQMLMTSHEQMHSKSNEEHFRKYETNLDDKRPKH